MLRCLVGLFALACATAAPAQDLRLIDLTGKFDEVERSTRGMDGRDRVDAFQKAMAGVADGFYARSRNPTRYERRVIANLANFPMERDKILASATAFSGMFEHARIGFERVFGPVTSQQPIYLVHSMGEMDGGTRDLDGKTTLLFGADVIAKVHDDRDIEPFLHHELFHLWHRPRFLDCEPMWCSLWEEGMATYVAAILNPQAGDAALMLTQPGPIRPMVDKDLPAAVCATLPLLASTDEHQYGKLFYGNAHLDGFPARMGYYLGYLVVADLGRTRSLAQLAALTPAQVEPLLRASLRSMAPSCTAKQ